MHRGCWGAPAYAPVPQEAEDGARPPPEPRPGLEALWPLALISASAVLVSLQAAAVKWLCESGFGGSTFEIVFWRGVFQSLGCCLALMLRGAPLHKWCGECPEERWLLFWRGLIGYGGCGFGYRAISLLPLAEAQVLSMAAPVFAALLARALLKEPWYRTDVLATALCATGMLLVTRPAPLFRSRRGHGLGLLFALLSAACTGGALVLVRALAMKAGAAWTAVVLAQASGQVAFSLPAMLVARERWLVPNLGQALLLSLCGVLGFLSHAALTCGMQGTESASASLLRQTLSPLCSLLWQLLLFPRATLLPTTALGAALMLAGVALTLASKALRGHKTDAAATSSGGAAAVERKALVAPEDSADDAASPQPAGLSRCPG